MKYNEQYWRKVDWYTPTRDLANKHGLNMWQVRGLRKRYGHPVSLRPPEVTVEVASTLGVKGLARDYGVSLSRATKWLKQLGVAFYQGRNFWAGQDWQQSDRAIAEWTGYTKQRVYQARRTWGKPRG